MDSITTKSTSRQTADIIEDFILGEPSSSTRKVFRAQIVDNQKDIEANVRGCIIHQRKKNSDEWEDIKAINLNSLKGGEGVKLELKSGQIKDLLNAIRRCKEIANKGIHFGDASWEVFEKDDTKRIIEIPANRETFIKELVEQNHSEELWNELVSVDPDLATKLALSRIQLERRIALKEFETSLSEDKDESYWQNYFEKNTWIFGYGLNYQFLHLLQNQPNYGGVSVNGKGSQRGDYLMNTVANTKFTVLVEIKKESTLLLNTEKYRNGAFHLSKDMVGAISQLQVNCKTWENEGAELKGNRENFFNAKIYTHEPKGILVIGNTNQLDNYEKRNSFELYRQNIHTPEIITFDELFERAKYIVGSDIEKEEIDCPF